MTLVIDGQQIDRLLIDDVEMETLVVDDVLVFQGPEPGAVEQFVLHAIFQTGKTGYDSNVPQGDLVPAQFRDVFINEVADYQPEVQFKIQFTTTTDLGQDFFYLFGILDTGVELLSENAAYTFDGNFATWIWPQWLQLSGSNFYDCVMYQKELPEVVVDFEFLPGNNGSRTLVGYQSDFENQPYGDLEPPTYKNATLGLIIENLAAGDFTVKFEDVSLPSDYWREIEFSSIGISFLAADAVYFTDGTGSKWTFAGAFPSFVAGVNYPMRMRGKQEALYVTQMTLQSEEQESTNFPGEFFRGYSRFNQLNMGNLSPSSLKGQFCDGIFDQATGAEPFTITIDSATPLPQGYWHTCIVNPGNFIVKSIDMLFSNSLNDPTFTTGNLWVDPILSFGFQANVEYEVTFFTDSEALEPNTFGYEEYNTVAKEENDVLALDALETLYRGQELVAINLYPLSERFGVVIEGENKLQSFWKTLTIDELDYSINSNEMSYDRTAFTGKLVWYTDKNLPALVDGESYLVRLTY